MFIDGLIQDLFSVKDAAQSNLSSKWLEDFSLAFYWSSSLIFRVYKIFCARFCLFQAASSHSSLFLLFIHFFVCREAVYLHFCHLKNDFLFLFIRSSFLFSFLSSIHQWLRPAPTVSWWFLSLRNLTLALSNPTRATLYFLQKMFCREFRIHKFRPRNSLCKKSKTVCRKRILCWKKAQLLSCAERELRELRAEQIFQFFIVSLAFPTYAINVGRIREFLFCGLLKKHLAVNINVFESRWRKLGFTSWTFQDHLKLETIYFCVARETRAQSLCMVELMLTS